MKLRDFADREPWLNDFLGPVQPIGEERIDFYRVEDPDRLEGPYNDRRGFDRIELSNDLGDAHGRRYGELYGTHPNPYDDPGLNGISPSEKCGFVNEFKLRDWFSGWGDRLTDAGYVINVYSVPAYKVRSGKYQDVAQLSHLKPTKTLVCADVLTSDIRNAHHDDGIWDDSPEDDGSDDL